MHNPAAPPPEVRDVQIAGTRMSVRQTDGGGGEVDVLLVHGLASNAMLWDGVSQRLAARGHRVVAVDQRGHGRSDLGRRDLTFSAVAADLVALADAMGMSRPLLAGQSWGGNVALEAAGRHPDAFCAVAAVDGGFIDLGAIHPDPEHAWQELAPPTFEGMTAETLRAQMARGMAGWPAGAVRAQMGNLHVHADGSVSARLDRQMHEQIIRDMWATDPVDRAAAVTVPVTLLPVRGGQDRWAEVKQDGVQRLVSALDDVEVRWLDGHHDIHLQKPDAVAEVLRCLAGRAAS